jgi:hypothetical protein
VSGISEIQQSFLTVQAKLQVLVLSQNPCFFREIPWLIILWWLWGYRRNNRRLKNLASITSRHQCVLILQARSLGRQASLGMTCVTGARLYTAATIF